MISSNMDERSNKTAILCGKMAKMAASKSAWVDNMPIDRPVSTVCIILFNSVDK